MVPMHLLAPQGWEKTGEEAAGLPGSIPRLGDDAAELSSPQPLLFEPQISRVSVGHRANRVSTVPALMELLTF